MGSAKKSRPRTKPPEERREELMNAAERLFLKHGVGPTTIEQITLAADVAKGTFYLYFSSKEDVLAALEERFSRDLLTKIKSAVEEEPEKDWRGKLAAWVAACVHGYLDSIRLHDILFYTTRQTTREGLVDNIVIDHLVELLQCGADEGVWSIDSPRPLAVFVFSGLHAVVDDAYSKGEHMNRSRLIRRIEQMCARTLGMSHH